MSRMPGVNSLEVFQQDVNEFDVTSLRLTIDPAALAAARQSLDQSGLLLLGEVHGVRQNPLLARALMAALEVTGLALEWPAGLAAAVSGFFADGRVPDHPQLWGGDGRITVGHFALLRERFQAAATAGADPVRRGQRGGLVATRVGDGRAHTQRPGTGQPHAGDRGERAHRADADDARGPARGAAGRVAAGRARDPHQIRQRHLLQPLRRSGSTHQFSLRRRARLRAEGGALVLELPAPMQARVPHRVAAEPGPRLRPSPPGYAGAFTPYRDRAGLPPLEPAGQHGYPDFPDYPQQAKPPVPPVTPQAPAAPAEPQGTAAPSARRRGDPTRTRRG